MTFANIYLFPIVVAIVLIFVSIVFSQRLRFEKQFGNEFSNRLYALSFIKPFSWFVSEDESDDRAKEDERLIKGAGLDHVLNHRVLNTFTVILLLGLMVVYSTVLMFINEINIFLNLIFRIEADPQPILMETRLIVGVFLLTLVLLPKIYLKRRAKKNAYHFLQELPVLQLSIILMLRAKRTMDEIMYTLGHNNTRYRRIFQKAHRIYNRSKEDCWDYLNQEFEGTGFTDTIDTLSNINEYSVTETVRVLENGMELLVDEANKQKETGAAFGNLYSQFSMALPFGGLILLGAVPFVMYIFNLMADQSVF